MVMVMVMAMAMAMARMGIGGLLAKPRDRAKRQECIAVSTFSFDYGLQAAVTRLPVVNRTTACRMHREWSRMGWGRD
jgi:hypothetical protein